VAAAGEIEPEEAHGVWTAAGAHTCKPSEKIEFDEGRN